MTPADAADRPWLAVYRELGVHVPQIEDITLAQYVERHAAHYPQQPALDYRGRSIGYRQLDELGNRFADALRQQGIRAGDVIGIHLPNIPQYVIALVGASRLGCIASGVSTLLTPVELVHQINDAGVKVLVTLDAVVAGTLTGIGAALPQVQLVLVTAVDELPAGRASGGRGTARLGRACVRSFAQALTSASAHPVHERADPSATFLIQYTGGTTGKAKGAELSVRSVMYNLEQYSAFWGLAVAAEVLGSVLPLYHIAGLTITLLALRYAGRALMAPDPRDVAYLCAHLRRVPPTLLAGVPSLYQMLLARAEFAALDFSRLKVAAVGSAPFTVEEKRRLERTIGSNRISDLYGMTETGPVSVCNPPARNKSGALGIPVPGTDVRIVDVDTGQREMPTGEPGEIISRGPQLMKGYRNLPQETRKALREFRGETWMYTGDVGVMDEEGYVTLCDRLKDMLVVGGYKVFSVEVEEKLKGLDFIVRSAVIGAPDSKRPGNDVVTLFVELAPSAKGRNEEDLAREIERFCRGCMAPYKVPKSFRFVEAMPLTGVGKIDKKALRKELV